MEILIIEDDHNKYQHIHNFLDRAIPETKFVTKKSYQSGLREALKKAFDLIVLDMSLPTYDINPPEELGGPFRTYAGEEILFELKRRGHHQAVLIVTQFESFGEGDTSMTLNELKDRLARLFSELYIDTIYYNAFETSWKEELSLIINRLLVNKND